MKTDFSKLDRAFNPQCVVVVGDSMRNNFQWLRGQGRFKGKLYSVQVNPETIKGIEAIGITNYTSLLDIPERVDLVIVTAPRSAAIKILEDCIGKEVAAAHFFTSGFAETDTEDGIRLERTLKEKAEQANFHLVGPNCMGIFNPRVGIGQNIGQYNNNTGTVGFISQSGTHAQTFAYEAHVQGVDISKSVSFGNGTVLDSTNYLEYFGSDPDCKIIGMYLEGVKDGRWFFQVLREVTTRKPVVIWKGGRTEEGGRAISSHTGSLAVPQAIWESAVRQCGAVQVARMEEMVDTLKALLFLPSICGNRVGITGGSGGQSVAIADVFAEAGLSVPSLTQESYDKLMEFYSLIGGGYRNPVDTGNQNSREMGRILEILGQDANIDNLVLLSGGAMGGSERLQNQIDLLADIGKRNSKAVVAVVSYSAPDQMRAARDATKSFQKSGIPTFPSMERAALALRNTLEYYRRKNGTDTR